ncbi:MAG: ion transporter [Granulosicoccus sp.]
MRTATIETNHEMSQETEDQTRANQIAPAMFALSVLFVVLLASLIVLRVDIPRVAELAIVGGTESEAVSEISEDLDQVEALVQKNALVRQAGPWARGATFVLFLLWPLFWLEYAFSLRLKSVQQTTQTGKIFRILACLAPPLRMATPSAAQGGKIWLPNWGWRLPGKALHANLMRAFSKPMLIIALLILPVLLVEFGLQSLVEQHQWLRILLHLCTGFIWCAFTIEFIIMMSTTDKRFAYVKKNWIDLAIILLPLVSFLRSIRVLRLARLAKVQKLAKMGRVFRMRGLAMKTMRALMLFGFINRLLRITPEKRLRKLKDLYEDQEEELADLQLEINELEESIALEKHPDRT